jgi:hypothetical protein
MVVDIEIGSPLKHALQTEKDMTLSNEGQKIPGATFPLRGSSAALAKLIATCSKP